MGRVTQWKTEGAGDLMMRHRSMKLPSCAAAEGARMSGRGSQRGLTREALFGIAHPADLGGAAVQEASHQESVLAMHGVARLQAAQGGRR